MISKQLYIEKVLPKLPSFWNAVDDRGLILSPDQLERDGVWHCVSVVDDHGDRKSGGYKCNGYYGKQFVNNFRDGKGVTTCEPRLIWIPKSSKIRPSEIKPPKSNKVLADDLAILAASKACWLYGQHGHINPTRENNTYLKSKGIDAFGKPYPKVDQNGKLLIPMRIVGNKNITGLQIISKDSGKKFLRGTRKKGCIFYSGELGQEIEDRRTRPLIICEGYATGASIHNVTGCDVLVAFDAGNIKPVVELLISLLKNNNITHCGIVIAADNDHANKIGNVGIDKAKAVAEQFDLVWVAPEFDPSETTNTDFNDLCQSRGAEELKKVFCQFELK
jgi:phage/plasmid primase-like uncharacterized protein